MGVLQQPIADRISNLLPVRSFLEREYRQIEPYSEIESILEIGFKLSIDLAKALIVGKLSEKRLDVRVLDRQRPFPRHRRVRVNVPGGAVLLVGITHDFIFRMIDLVILLNERLDDSILIHENAPFTATDRRLADRLIHKYKSLPNDAGRLFVGDKVIRLTGSGHHLG